MAAMRDFLLFATRHLHKPIWTEPGIQVGPLAKPQLRSWCAFATFRSIAIGARYYNAELPAEADLMETYTRDGGAWVQWGPISYDDIAHVIIPRSFDEECGQGRTFSSWEHQQDIVGLSRVLFDAGVEHRLSEYALEVKRY
jgi:hypothetical protein